MADTDLIQAVAYLRNSKLQLGPDWTAAHDIVQNHEGQPAFDALHALLHRIEGDDANAAYWDKRAGTDFGGQEFDNELAELEKLAGA